MESGARQITAVDLNTFTTTPMEDLGTLGLTKEGRYFRYVAFGGTSTIKAGMLCVGPAAPANSTGLAITATTVAAGGQLAANLVVGSKTLVVTNGATAVTANQFQYLEIISSADQTYSLRIAGHTSAGASGYVVVSLADPIPQGATTLIPGTDTVNLVLSQYNGVAPSLTGNAPVGVTTNVVPNTASVTNYGWVQSGGKAMVKATTATIGLGIAQDLAGTAGYVIIAAATTGNIGWAKASATGSAASVVLNIN
jgi:hypothetical protein